MLGNLSYCNPTKLYFGEEALHYLNDELPKYGTKVMLIYGGDSIKKNGIYDQITENCRCPFLPLPAIGKTEILPHLSKRLRTEQNLPEKLFGNFILRI